MTRMRLAVVLASSMVVAAVVGIAVRPSNKAAASNPKYVLESVIPKQFGEWKEMPNQTVQVVNPQTKELLDKIYSQILTRTYANARGYRIMLSIAYGDDQRGELRAHRPEVCYPAQGFALHNNVEASIVTPFGNIAGRRLDTSLGARREPVTYWFTMGDKAVQSRLQQRLIEVRMGLTGQVPDGLLFRVSSIDGNPPHAYERQRAFVADLLKAVPARDRTRLSGLESAPEPN